jgi:uncharacterized protein involved in type VI secretion and phage assembly
MAKAPPPTKPTSRQNPATEGDLSSPEQAEVTRLETAQYIAEFAVELSLLAREARLDLLSYLMDMARLEALRIIQADHRNR